MPREVNGRVDAMVYENFSELDEDFWGSDDGMALHQAESEESDAGATVAWREWVGPLLMGANYGEAHRVQCLGLIQFRNHKHDEFGPKRTGFLLIMQNYQIVIA